MAAEVDPQNYKDVVLFLATAGIVAPLFRRLKISPILGFLGAGVVLGPFGLGALADQVPWLGAFTIENPAEIAQLAEFGVGLRVVGHAGEEALHRAVGVVGLYEEGAE